MSDRNDLDTMDERRRRARPLRFLGLFTTAVVLCLAANLGISLYNVGRPTGASAGFCRNIEDRVARGQAIQEPKIVFIGGSGARRGISTRMIGDTLSVATFNFGLQAALGPEVILHEARKILKPGDTAVLAFEYNHYAFARWNDIALNAIFGCLTDVFHETSLAQKIEMLMALPPDRALQVLRFAPSARAVSDDATESEGDSSYAALPEPRMAIAHGDIPFDPHWWKPLSDEQKRRLSVYQPIRISFDGQARGTQEIARFVAWARENGIKVAMTWPNTIDFAAYRGETAFDAIREFYEGMAVPVVGEPSLGFYPAELFWDTQYHLSAPGVYRRTRDLAAALSAYPEILPPPREKRDRDEFSGGAAPPLLDAVRTQ